MRQVRTAAAIIIGTAALIVMIWASFNPRCPGGKPDECQQISRQGLSEIVKDRP